MNSELRTLQEDYTKLLIQTQAEIVMKEYAEKKIKDLTQMISLKDNIILDLKAKIQITDSLKLKQID
tara:strand:- start:130 stop:330 length:201 start_codon:yes stop_codon:yes gene_type:complete